VNAWFRRNSTSTAFIVLYPILALIVLCCLCFPCLYRRLYGKDKESSNFQPRENTNDDPTSPTNEGVELLYRSPSHSIDQLPYRDKVHFHEEADSILNDFQDHMNQVSELEPSYERAGWQWRSPMAAAAAEGNQGGSSSLPFPLPPDATEDWLSAPDNDAAAV